MERKVNIQRQCGDISEYFTAKIEDPEGIYVICKKMQNEKLYKSIIPLLKYLIFKE